MPLTLYFLRHGQTPMSRDNVFCGAGLNPELTSEGLAMAEAFAATYRSMPWKAIYASSLRRAIMTAEPICKATGMTMEIRDDLKEIAYGKWEGQTVAAVDREYHDAYIRWTSDPAWHAPVGGEMAIEIARRTLRVIEEINERYTDGNVLIVSHKATIRIMLCGLLGIDVGRFRYRLACPVASVSIVEFNTQGPLLRVLADRAHLTEGLRTLPGT